MVYLLRRHKVNDYRGHYRLWLWVSAWCLAASLETATEIHQALQAIVLALPFSLSAEELNWGWLIGVSLGGLVLAVRMSIEVRESYWTNCFWLPAVAAYSAVMLLAFDVSWIHNVLPAPLTGGLLLVNGHTALVATVWMEARHVFRDAQGMLPAKKVKPVSVTATIEESPVQEAVADEPVFEEPEDEKIADSAEEEYLLAEETVDMVAEENWEETADDLQEQRIRRKQQRAERKRLRRQQRKERRRRAA